MYPRIVYRGTVLPERRPKLREHECVFTTPDFDTATEYAKAQITGKVRSAYVQEYELPEDLKILDLNTDPLVPEILAAYLERTSNSEEEYNRDLFFAAEHSSQKFVDLMKTVGYDGFYVERAGPGGELWDDEVLCVFNPLHLKFVGRFTVKAQRQGNHWSIR